MNCARTRYCAFASLLISLVCGCGLGVDVDVDVDVGVGVGVVGVRD